jgi:REP element-mobilizing transposase RayT
MLKDRKSIRLKGYDYSSDNLYFVTSCVQNRTCCFGKIKETGRDPSLPSSKQNYGQSGSQPISQMILNEYGEIAKKQWAWLSEQYHYIFLHAFVVMPNHIHGIIEINRSRFRTSDPVKIKPLSEVIGAYKTTVSKQIHLAGLIEFQWQRSFFEHIIRDDKSLDTITDYIINNPENWENDEFNN